MVKQLWPVIPISIVLLAIGLSLYALSDQRPKPCIQPKGAEFGNDLICLSLKDTYVCNVKGVAVTYPKDVESVN